MKIYFLIIICTAITFCNGQSTFKKFKDLKTGAITTYSEGLSIKSAIGSDENIGVLQPRFNSGGYYLKFSSNEITQDGQFSYLWKYCFFNTNIVGQKCYVRLYIKIDDTRVFKLIGKGKMNNGGGEVGDFSFAITSKEIALIATASKISIDFETKDLDDFENFPYSYVYDDLAGFRDFCDGMKIALKK